MYNLILLRQKFFNAIYAPLRLYSCVAHGYLTIFFVLLCAYPHEDER